MVNNMKEIMANLDTIITSLIDSLGMYGPLLGSFLILVESILPILPLSVFITLNFYAFGNLLGFLISYILTVMGCNIAFYISRKLLINKMDKIYKRYGKNKIVKLVKNFSNFKFKNLVLLMAFPFTPAFLVNIMSGISDMDHNKFLIASIVGKPFMVYFWGYIGVTLLQSLTHPEYLIKIAIMLVVAYILSYIINKKLDID